MANKDWLQKGADGLTFGERLGDLINSRGVSQTQLEAETGIKQSAFSEYINGRKRGTESRAPDCAAVISLAKYFGVATDYLLGLTDIKSASITVQSIIKQTGLNEQAVELLLWLKSINWKYPLDSFATDMILGTLHGNDAMMGYISMMAALKLPKPPKMDESDPVNFLVEKLLFDDDVSRHGVAILSAEESFHYHAKKIGEALTKWLIDTYEGQGAWNQKEEP